MSSDLNIKEARDKLITIALARTNGSREKAAELLGISRRHIYKLIRERLNRDE